MASTIPGAALTPYLYYNYRSKKQEPVPAGTSCGVTLENGTPITSVSITVDGEFPDTVIANAAGTIVLVRIDNIQGHAKYDLVETI